MDPLPPTPYRSQPRDPQAPVFVTAPTARNGVTLLQRLLNSSRQIIVYGENAHFCEHLPAAVCEMLRIQRTAAQTQAESRRRFLQETTEFWTSNLWPDAEAYLNQTLATFQDFARLYATCTKRYGYNRWGIKHPFSSIAAFESFFMMFPQARFVYVYRNVFDVARSAKARRFVKNAADCARLAASWQQSVLRVRDVQRDNLLRIRYEDLVAEPNAWITRLADFTGVTGIDPSIMQRKINTFRGPRDHGYSPTEYIAPTALTDEEHDAIASAADAGLRAMHYVDRAGAAANARA